MLSIVAVCNICSHCEYSHNIYQLFTMLCLSPAAHTNWPILRVSTAFGLVQDDIIPVGLMIRPSRHNCEAKKGMV